MPYRSRTRSLQLAAVLGVCAFAWLVLETNSRAPDPLASVELSVAERDLADALIHGAAPCDDRVDEFMYVREHCYLGTPNPLLPEIDAIRTHPRSEVVLEQVLRGGSAGAKLYALTLLRDVGGPRFGYWFDRLKDDPTPVVPTDGCTVWPSTLGTEVRKLSGARRPTFEPQD